MKKLIIVIGLFITVQLQAQRVPPKDTDPFVPHIFYVTVLDTVMPLGTRQYEMHFVNAAGRRDTVCRRDQFIKYYQKRIGLKYMIYADTVHLWTKSTILQ